MDMKMMNSNEQKTNYKIQDVLLFPTMGIFAKKMPYFIAFLLKNLSTYDELSTDKCRILSYMKSND